MFPLVRIDAREVSTRDTPPTAPPSLAPPAASALVAFSLEEEEEEVWASVVKRSESVKRSGFPATLSSRRHGKVFGPKEAMS